MAASGNFSSSYLNGAFVLRVVWSENTVNIAANTSKITATAYLDMSSGSSLSVSSRSNTFSINGKDYSFSSSSISKSAGSAKTVTLGSVTSSAIAHNSDGSKSVTIKCTFNINATLGGKKYTSFTASKTVNLSKIARLSSLSASNGTLGTAQNLAVTKQDSSYTHTITYSCGSASGTICTKSSSSTVSFTPPLSLAAQNKTGTSVSITFTITTYSGSSSLGSSTKTITCSIPASIKPTVTMTVTDPTGYMNTFGNPVKGKSKLNISLSVTLGGESPIKSYSVTANGESFTTAQCETSSLKAAGTNTITATVTDARGRTATATQTISVLDYSPPEISSIKVARCNQDGTSNDQGEYIKVTFSGKITPLNNSNTKSWKIAWKKPSGNSVTSAQNLSYTVDQASYIFAAETGSSYVVSVEAKDYFETVTRTTTASTALTIKNYKANGKGMAVGKVSELDNVFDVGFQTKFSGGILYNEITSGTNLDDLKTPGFYRCTYDNVGSLSNCPVDSTLSVPLTLKIETGGTTSQVRQIITICHNRNKSSYVRCYYSDSWTEWEMICPRGSFAVVKRYNNIGNTGSISQSGTWLKVTLDKYSSHNESNYLNDPLYIEDGYIKTRFPGSVAISAAIRISSELNAGDSVSIGVFKEYKDNNNNTVTKNVGGVWDYVATSNKASLITPAFCDIAQKDDKYYLCVRNSTGARGTLYYDDCLLSLFYI